MSAAETPEPSHLAIAAECVDRAQAVLDQEFGSDEEHTRASQRALALAATGQLHLALHERTHPVPLKERR